MKLEEMIKKLCPEGVKYVKLGDVAIKYTDGMHNLPKEISDNERYPILSAKNINNRNIDLITSKYVSESVFEKENKRTNVKKGDVLLTIVGAIGRVAVVKFDLKALFQRSVCIIKPDNNIILSEYLAFVLESSEVQKYILINSNGAAQKGLYLEQVGKIKIPLPPLEIQEEIVKILDIYSSSVTELQNLLNTELTARQKQYEYYRDMLLDFESVRGGGDN